MYADNVTDSMQRAIDETNRRRKIQVQYNVDHGIEPRSIVKAVHDLTERVAAGREGDKSVAEKPAGYGSRQMPKPEIARLIKELEKQMREAAAQLEFEKAALLRDEIFELKMSLEAPEGLVTGNDEVPVEFGDSAETPT